MFKSITYPKLFLLIFPLFIAISFYTYGYYHYYYADIQLKNDFSEIYIKLILVFGYVCFVIVIIYGIHPLKFTSDRYQKMVNGNIAIEFDLIKKMFLIGMPALISLTIINFVITSLGMSVILQEQYLYLYDLLFAILIFSMAITMGSALRFTTYLAKKEFRFYLAKGYCLIARNNDDELDKIKYLLLSLDSYNKYLIRKTNYGINKIDLIYSKILLTNSSHRNDFISSLDDCMDNDKLCIIALLKSYSESKNEHFFIKEKLIQKLQSIGALLSVSVPILISVIQLVYHFINGSSL